MSFEFLARYEEDKENVDKLFRFISYGYIKQLEALAEEFELEQLKVMSLAANLMATAAEYVKDRDTKMDFDNWKKTKGDVS